jgi:hypothetical protein
VYRASVRSLILALLVAPGVLACESTSSPVEVYERDVTPEMVTGAALAALRSDGRFNLEEPVTEAGQVSLQEAKTQTLQFARYVTNQLLLRGVVEGERGGYWTDPQLLALCRSAYFVHSQLGAMATDTVPESAGQSFKRRFGSQWLIPMCGSDDDPQMTVQVAIDANDIRFADGAPIEPFSSLTTAWYARGVPLNWPDPLPLSAERAVRFAWETFGLRVTEVPQLYFRGDILSKGTYAWYQIGSARFCNRWRVVLENDVTVRGMTTFSQSTTRVLWIASASCSQRDVEPWLHIPLTEQPSVATLDYIDYSVNPTKTWMLQVPVVAPIRFEIGGRAP